MNIDELYQRLVQQGCLEPASRTLRLDPAALSKLGLDTNEVEKHICSHFAGGRIELDGSSEWPRPTNGSIKLQGTSRTPPFAGLSITLELDVHDLPGGKSKLVLIAEATGHPDAPLFTLAQTFPRYRGTLLEDLQLYAPDEPGMPVLRLASMAIPERSFEQGAMRFLALLDLRTLKGVAGEYFFSGRKSGEDFIAITGGIVPFPPHPSRPGEVLAAVRFEGGTAPLAQQLFGFLPIENAFFSFFGEPRFNTATLKWQVDTSWIWRADLALGALKIPIGVSAAQNSSMLRVWSDLREAFSIGLRDLYALIPGAALEPPAEVKPQGRIGISRVEMTIDTSRPLRDAISWMNIGVEYAADERWVLIDRVAALSSIEVDFSIARPANNPSVEINVSGLIEIGEKGALELSALIAPGSDYEFNGELLQGTSVELTEIFAHFLGHERLAGFPNLSVTNFWFRAVPKSRAFSGLLKLGGTWKIAGAGTLVLDALAFELSRSRDGATTFNARGVFELGALALFVSADHQQNGNGWTFEGGTFDDRAVPLGALVADALTLLSGSGATPLLPAPLAGLALSALRVRFNTGSGDVSLHGGVEFPIDRDRTAALALDIDLRTPSDGGAREVSFSGRLRLQERELTLRFDRAGSDLIAASYAKSGGEKIELAALVENISTDFAAIVPRGIELALDHLLLAIAPKQSGGNRFLFGVELGAGVELSRLPLVGRAFERSQTLAVTIQVTIVNDSFSRDEARRINALALPETTHLADEAIDASKSKVHVRAALSLGGKSFPVNVPLELPDSGTGLSISRSATEAPSELTASWFAIQKSFGPFHFERAGVALSADKTKLELLFDASLLLSGLTLSLAGLGAELELAKLSRGELEPSFHLDGIGLDFKRGDLEIGGALLRRGPGTYDGGVVVHCRSLGIVAVGSLAEISGKPSIFAYAVVDYPLGGPAFFFVEGLTFGFGYNRSVAFPELEQVASFPLVALARRPPQGLTIGELAAQLSPHLRPAEGEYFVAAGVRFTSFKIIEGTLLFAVVFGKHFEVDILGMATISSPPRASGAPLLMFAELGLAARYRPEDGVVTIRGALLPSAYLFSPDCHLTGGFALCVWPDTGDFVATIGGYHRDYRRPAHYPTVPRLALSWQVSENLSLKADAYFAVTPAAFMAGGHLSANWVSGDLHAWFNAGIDCLVEWQPYHYRAEAEISIGASYRTWIHTFTVELGARLKIWGPPFSGTAHVSWYIFSFDVAFGPPPVPSKALTWVELKESFLPGELLTASVGSGLAAPHGAAANASNDRNAKSHLGLLNARELSITVHSAVPITAGDVAGVQLPAPREALGVPPMKAGKLESKMSVEVRRAGQRVEGAFACSVEERSVPNAVWGHKKPNGPNDPALTRAITGVTLFARPIAPDDPKTPAQSPTNRTHGKIDATRAGRVIASDVTNVRAHIRDTVLRTDVRRARAEMLAALLPSVAGEWSDKSLNELRSMPRLVRAGT